MIELPKAVATVADVLAAMPGAVAVVLGGSRALGTASASSDWDLGVYYRGDLDTTELARLGTVYAPGSWGRVMNGGAWLSLEGKKVDVLLRDLDVVDHWAARAQNGAFEVDALLGYLAGVPTYSLVAERAVAIVLRGTLARDGEYPSQLAETAPARWRFCAGFSLMYARMHAERGDAVGAAGQVAKAFMEEAHARLCAEKRWALNEKRLIATAGLADGQSCFEEIPRTAPELARWVSSAARALGHEEIDLGR